MFIGRGKKKKKKESMSMILGSSMIAAMALIIMFMKIIAVTLSKAFFFTFITKFLVSMSWKSSSTPKKKHSHKDVTILMA